MKYNLVLFQIINSAVTGNAETAVNDIEALPEIMGFPGKTVALRMMNFEERIKFPNAYLLCGTPRLILQRINTNIFKDPDGLMENIENVTAFLHKKIQAEGGNPDRETLTVIKTVDGKNCYKHDDNNVFRMYIFIEHTKSIENDKTYDDLYEAGLGFGRFQRMLEDFPVEILHETIPDFHNTPKRVEELKKAIEENLAGRRDSVQEEIKFALEKSAFADRVVKGMEAGKIPMRVTHNDTKINNILFVEKTGKAVSVIDLDTVMPGSMLYDFGDAHRIHEPLGFQKEHYE